MRIAAALWSGVGQAASVLPRRWTAPRPTPNGRADVLIHGASAGEVKAARAVEQELRRAAPSRQVLITTGTSAGMAAGADARLPRDVPARLAEMLDRVRPSALVLVEGELWPNLLALAARRGLPVGVVGARVSPVSARAHGLLRSPLFGIPTAWAVATSSDAERIVALGAPAARVRVTGWLKWPEPVVTADPERSRLIARHPGRGPLFVLGSVHPGEVAEAWRQLAGTDLNPARSRWVVVPRHVRRARRFQAELPPGALLDPRFGVLRGWYADADAALVGGGFAGKGTHDLLEPLQSGLPPLFFGPGDDVARTLVSDGLALPITDGVERGALTRVPQAWARLKADHDGRLAGLRFLASRGVPVLP